MPSRFDRAKELASLGFRVFPLVSNGKVPAIDAWPDRATNDTAQLAAWFDDPVADRNIGIAAGDGLLVVDLDAKKGKNGEKALEQLALTHGELPATLAARTPTGGLHLYYTAKHDTANSAGKLGQGIDTRSHHGYVVAPGSDIDDQPYEWLVQAPIAEAPQWLIDLLDKPTERAEDTRTPAVLELDTTASLRTATHYLANEAPAAIEGAAGDLTTYKVAARLKDIGLSQNAARDLMLAHWNERCSPPWPIDELERKIANAYRYGANPPGATSPEADFGAATLHPLEPKPILPFDAKELPPRRWILSNLLIRGFVTVIIAPPGVGKTTLMTTTALAVATGRGEIVNASVKERTRVWYYNNEDDEDELKRRFAAARQHFKIEWNELAVDHRPGVFINSGTDRPLVIASRGGHDGRKMTPADVDQIIAHIKASGIGVFIADPFIETHHGDENDNQQVAAVARLYRRIAVEGDCAVVIVHHTRKPPAGASDGHAGNMDSGRGASALMGVARIAHTLYGMSEKDAKRWGVASDNRHRYVRFDSAKGNLTLTTGKPLWFERVSVALQEGEEVGVLAPVALMESQDPSEHETALLHDIVSAMEGERRVVLRTLLARLREGYPVYAGLEGNTLGMRIRTAIGDGAEADGGVLTLEKDRDNPKALYVVAFEHLTQRDKSEDAEIFR